jgi:amino-acid N-acetyltransferase
LTKQNWKIRKARISDVEIIHGLISLYAGQIMLARSRSELYESLRDFFVAENGGGAVVACAGLEIAWADLAEVKSLAVEKSHQQQGIGRAIVGACLDEARDLGIKRVFALTYQVDFFLKLGFKKIPKEQLPHKIWSDCLKCAKFPDCDEVAMAIDM